MDESLPTAPAPTELDPHEEVKKMIRSWRERWYPDPAAEGHPAPPYSGAWHHAHAAVADLYGAIVTLLDRSKS
jgi:hypothetical protein